jgi:RNA polymerase sigma-70 factor (ECF subfamily)
VYPLVGVDASGLASLRAHVAHRLRQALPAYAVPACAASAPTHGLAIGGAPLAAGLGAPVVGRPAPRTSRHGGGSRTTADSGAGANAAGAGALSSGAPAQRSGTQAPGAGATTRRPPADSDSLRMMEQVERAQQGEAEAFGKLYDHYSDTVYRYIYYRVSSKATAEDLTSETFLRALRRIGTFTWQGRDFGAWLVTIARNLVADHFKSSRFRLEVTTGEMLDANEVARSPEESVLESLSNEALLQAVRKLNPQQQECVTLRFLQGLSVAETARIMNKNEGAIKTLQYRAVRTLARLLPEDAR